MPVFAVSNDIEANTEVVAAEHQQNYSEIESFVNGSLVHADGYKMMNGGVNLLQGADATEALGSVTKQQMDAAFAAFSVLPPGMGGLWFTDVAPTGFALLQGQQLAKVDNPILWGLWGDTFGVSTADFFYAPDMRTRVPVGKGTNAWNNTLGAKAGSADAIVVTHGHTMTHGHADTFAVSAAGAHNHNLDIRLGTSIGSTQFPNGSNGGGTPSVAGTGSQPDHVHALTGAVTNFTGSTANAGSTGTEKNLQPYIVVNYIVKLG